MPRFLIKALVLLFGILVIYGWWLEPFRLCITQYDAGDPENPLQSPIRVLLLTDWHLGRYSRPSSLRAKMARLRKRHHSSPFDLILLGGDYVDIAPGYLELMTPSLEALSEFGIPIYAVLGNHDYSSFDGNITPVITCLENSGVHVLRNQAAVVAVRGQELLVVGLDDLQESPDYYDPKCYCPPAQYKDAAAQMDWYSKFDGMEPEMPRLLLSHNPDAVYLPGRKPLAVLCGHTHGGQIMLLDWISKPLHRWLHVHLPPGSAVTWAGRRIIAGRTLVVSRGIEGSSVPLRLLRPPEAVVVTLR